MLSPPQSSRKAERARALTVVRAACAYHVYLIAAELMSDLTAHVMREDANELSVMLSKMTSIEIAELPVRHDNVKRTTETLAGVP